MNFLTPFIPWVLVVQLGSGEIRIPFEHHGPFNSKECIKWEREYREQGLVAECEARLND
jgi:hypothetical protein